MEYVVTHSFTDKDTKEHYAVGDKYPHCGIASEERLLELSTDSNKRGIPLIKSAETVKETKKEKTDNAEQVSNIVTRDEVEKMKFFSVKSLATKNGIDVEGKTGAELKAEIIEKLNL